MTFVQEYTIYLLQGSQLFIFFKAFDPLGNKQFQIPSGNKLSHERFCTDLIGSYPSFNSSITLFLDDQKCISLDILKNQSKSSFMD